MLKSERPTIDEPSVVTGERKMESVEQIFQRANDAYIANRYEEARELYEKAAALGTASALNYLGLLYEYGLGVPRDLRKALEYYRQAADAGDPDAIYNVAVTYEDGLQEHVAVDLGRARELYERAAGLGDEDALVALAELYEKGKGVEKDADRAKRLYAEAAARGAPEAVRWLVAAYERENDVGKALETLARAYGRKPESFYANEIGRLLTSYGLKLSDEYVRLWKESDRIAALEQRIRELEDEIAYRPGGSGYKEAKARFETAAGSFGSPESRVRDG